MLFGNGIRFGDRLQSLSRVLDVGFQLGEHSRHLVAARPIRLVVHRHRHHRDQRCRRAVRRGRAGTCRSTPATNAITTSLTLTPKWLLTVLMSSRSSWANAMLRCPVTLALNAVWGAANGAAMPVRCGRACTVSNTDRHASIGSDVDQLQRAGGEPDRAADRDLQVELASPMPVDRIRRRRVGLGGAQLRHQVGSGHAVDAGVVHLGHHRQPSAVVGVGAATFSITHISHSGRLRSSGSDAMCPQISASSRRPPGDGQADAVQMPVDVEVLVLHPHRVVEVEPVVGELLAELRHRLDPQGEFVAQPVEGVAAGHRRGVELQDRAHMQWLCGGFEVQEAGVESAEPLHVADVMRASGARCEEIHLTVGSPSADR